MSKLERRTFFSLDELNEAIRAEMQNWNEKPFQKQAGTRRSLFEEMELPALKPLPRERYEFAEWREAKVHTDYHIQVDKHFYSVPHGLAGKRVEVRLTKNVLEVFFASSRVASQKRSAKAGQFTTLKEHMPMHHRDYVEQSAERFLAEAKKIGPWSHRFVQGVFTSRRYPQLGYRTCQGLLRLARKFGTERLEAACEKAVAINGFAYRTLESLLMHNLDQVRRTPADERKVVHLNIRGASYYNDNKEDTHADTTDTGEAAQPEVKRHADGAGAADGIAGG